MLALAELDTVRASYNASSRRDPYNVSSGCDCVTSLRLCLHGSCPRIPRLLGPFVVIEDESAGVRVSRQALVGCGCVPLGDCEVHTGSWVMF